MWSSNVFPVTTYDNKVDCSLRNTKLAAQAPLGVSLSCEEVLNFPDLLFCEFGTSILFTDAATSSCHRIAVIFCTGNPFKVTCPIIYLDAVPVVDLVTRRTGANEGKGYQSMNREMTFLTIPTETDAQISPVASWLEDIARSGMGTRRNSLHSSRITDLVTSFITNYITPLFSHRTPSTNANAATNCLRCHTSSGSGMFAKVGF